MTRMLACLLALRLAAAPDPDATDDAPLVVLVSTRADPDEADTMRLRRVSAEIEAAGFDVLVVGLSERLAEVDEERLAALAEEHDPRGLVVLDPGRNHARLWTVEGDHPPELRAIVEGDSSAETEREAVFAVRVAEVLQATLIRVAPVRTVAAPKAAPPPTAAPPSAPTRAIPPRWATRVGLHAVGTTGDLGFMLGPTLGATVAVGPRRRFGLDFEAIATGLEGKARSGAGEAAVGFAQLRGVAQWWPFPAARVSPGFGLGWAMLVAWTRGRAREPYDSRTDATVVSAPVGAADLAVSVSPRVRLRFGFRIGVAVPAVRVASDAGFQRTGQPIADGGLALEVVGPARQ